MSKASRVSGLIRTVSRALAQGGFPAAASPYASMPVPGPAKAGIPLLFKQHLFAKLPLRRDESIGF